MEEGDPQSAVWAPPKAAPSLPSRLSLLSLTSEVPRIAPPLSLLSLSLPLGVPAGSRDGAKAGGKFPGSYSQRAGQKLWLLLPTWACTPKLPRANLQAPPPCPASSTARSSPPTSGSTHSSTGPQRRSHIVVPLQVPAASPAGPRRGTDPQQRCPLRSERLMEEAFPREGGSGGGGGGRVRGACTPPPSVGVGCAGRRASRAGAVRPGLRGGCGGAGGDPKTLQPMPGSSGSDII